MIVYIPTPLRAYTAGQQSVEVTEEGKVRAFVNLYLNDEDIRYLPAKEATSVTATDTLSIIPSIAGGC